MSSLLVIKGPNIGVRYELGDRARIGRLSDSEIQVNDPNVSRMHAELVRQRGAYSIIDCGSKNGVIVNGKPVKERVLLRNDEVRIGNTVFLFNSDLNIKNARFSNNSVYLYPAADETQVDTSHTGRLDNLKGSDREAVEYILRLAEMFSGAPLPLPDTAERITSQIKELLGGDFAVLLTRDNSKYSDTGKSVAGGAYAITGENDTQEDVSALGRLADMHQRTRVEACLDLIPLVALPPGIPIVINNSVVKTVARDQVALLTGERAWRPKDALVAEGAGDGGAVQTSVGKGGAIPAPPGVYLPPPQPAADLASSSGDSSGSGEISQTTPNGTWRVDTSKKNPVAATADQPIEVPAHVTSFDTPDRSVSTMCAPVVADGQTIAVLLVERTEANAYSLRDLGLLQAAARLAAGTLQAAQLAERLRQTAAQQEQQTDPAQFLPSRSERIVEIFEAARRAAHSDVTILITGESGTGKEVLARHIHQSSRRAKGPFIAVNCSAIPANLFESELFGHEKGAFTGADRTVIGKVEAAHGGTLLLDEVGELELPMQPKLLRFLQDKAFYRVGGNRAIEADVRVIAATNQDLAALVREGKFREDLFYRLNVVPFHLPPLRERREDIAQMVDHLIARHSKRLGRRIMGANDAAISLLQKYDWPGNIRELENSVERAIILAQAKILTAGDFGHIDEARRRVKELGDIERKRETRPLEEVERMHILAALKRFNFNQARAAEALGVHRNTLRNKIIEYGIEIQKESRIQNL